MGRNEAIAVLRKLYLDANRNKYKSVPEYAFTIPKFNDKTANGLTMCILSFIHLKGFQAERINCMGRIIDQRQTYRNVLGQTRTIGSVKYGKTSGQRGTADISATIKGHSVKIEVKVGKDRQRPAQKEYQRLIEASGGIYFIAMDFQQFYNWYIETFEQADHV